MMCVYMFVHFRVFVSCVIFHVLHSLLRLEVQITDVYVLDNFPSLRTLIKEPQEFLLCECLVSFRDGQ